MHTLDPKAIGARIREVRGGATQQQFAALLDVGRVSVARYETGERTPDAEFIVRLWLRCDIDPMWLLIGVPTNPAENVPLEQPPKKLPLSPQEAELLDLYRRGDDSGRGLILKVAKHAAENPTQGGFDPEVTRERNRRAAEKEGLVGGPILTRRRRSKPQAKKA